MCGSVWYKHVHMIQRYIAYLCLSSDAYMSLNLAFLITKWFLNTNIGQCILTKYTLSIQVSSQEPTLTTQSLEPKWEQSIQQTWLVFNVLTCLGVRHFMLVLVKRCSRYAFTSVRFVWTLI